MELITAVVHRARKIANDLPDEQSNLAYGHFTAWLVIYRAVVELSGFDLVVDTDRNAHPMFRSWDSLALDDLILEIQKYDQGFCPAGADRPQVLRRQVATAVMELAFPRLPFDD